MSESLEELIKYSVLHHLNQWDPAGLSPGLGEFGAPFDEYLRYAVSVQHFLETHWALSSSFDPKPLADFIASEFSKGLGMRFETNAELINLAKDIEFHASLLRDNRAHSEIP